MSPFCFHRAKSSFKKVHGQARSCLKSEFTEYCGAYKNVSFSDPLLFFLHAYFCLDLAPKTSHPTQTDLSLPKGCLVSLITMRSLVFSGTTLFACGFSVFGRPLSTRQEIGNLNQNTPSWYQDPTSAMPTNPFALATLPTLPISSTSMDTPIPDFHFGSYKSGTSLPPEVKPEYPILASAYTSTPDKDSTFQLDSGGDSITNGLPESLFEMSARVVLPTISEDVQLTISNLKIRKYCIYELSPDRSELKFKTCDPSPDWQMFRQAFDDSGIGFALYHLDDGQILSIMNLIHDHCQTKQGEKWLYCLPCDMDEEMTLQSLKQNWRVLVTKVFPDVAMVSFDSISTDNALQRIGQNWDLVQNVSRLVDTFSKSYIRNLPSFHYLANAF